MSTHVAAAGVNWLYSTIMLDTQVQSSDIYTVQYLFPVSSFERI